MFRAVAVARPAALAQSASAKEGLSRAVAVIIVTAQHHSIKQPLNTRFPLSLSVKRPSGPGSGMLLLAATIETTLGLSVPVRTTADTANEGRPESLKAGAGEQGSEDG